MAAYPQPNLVAYKAGGTIVKGHSVKINSDNVKEVIECTAATDDAIGIAMNAAVDGGDVEVALPGGGAEVKAAAAFTRGFLLTSDTDGRVKKVATAGDRLVGVALEDAVENDLCPVLVILGHAYATES